MVKKLDRLRFLLRTYYHNIKIFFVSFTMDWFKIFSLIYFFVSIVLIAISYFKNYFVLIDDMSNFFLTTWWMLWWILALSVTIHFFYVQNFLNYSALIFISDISNSKKNYIILGTIWLLTLLFFFLWGNFNIFINQCPDYYLLPVSILLISLALWLIIYYFHDISKKLSPRGIIDETEKYFTETLKFLKKYNNLEKSYFNQFKIDIIKQKLLKVGTNYNKIWWYKLESMCDNYLKLMELKENRLAKDYLFSIENCFGFLIQSYEIVNTTTELEYLTDQTEIDGEINNFFERIESLIYMNIENNDVEWMVKTFWLLNNMILKTDYINYSSLDWKIKHKRILFFRLIIQWQQLFEKILKYNNEEAFFQRKEWAKKIILRILNNQDVNFEETVRIEGLLKYVNYLNFRVIKKQREDIFKLSDIYVLFYLSIIDGKIIYKWMRDDLNVALYEFMGNNKYNIDNFIQSIRFSLSMKSNFLIENTQKDKNYIKRILAFIDAMFDITNYISKKEWLKIWNREWLLIQQLWLYMFNTRNIEWIDQVLIKQWLNKIIDIIDVVINSKNKVFVENVMAEKDVYDQLCWIWVYAIKENDNELFERCFSIFSKHILEFSWSNYGLWEIKYFCYWLFIDEEKNHNKYFEILHRFFESELKKYWDEHIDYWKKEIERLINEVNWCFNMEEWDMDLQLSKFLLKDEEWVKPENQEKITKILFKNCSDILNSKKKK